MSRYDDSTIGALRAACAASGEKLPNMDHETGIRFGVCDSNAAWLHPESIDDISLGGEDLTYESALEDAKAELGDSWTDETAQDFADRYYSDGSTYLYEFAGYKITLCSDGDLFVEKSPYVAKRGLCSPCAPNACHMETDGDLLCYVLGPDWFDEEGAPSPYQPIKLEDLNKGPRDSQRDGDSDAGL